jgi:transcriptional regulator with XRE-family HTH domain
VNRSSAWVKYVRALIEGGSAAAFSERTGLATSTVSRWLSGEYEPKPRQAVQVARAYGLSPIGALVAAEFLDEDEIELPAARPRLLRLTDFTELELSMEIVRRIASRTDTSELLETPLDDDHPAMQQLAKTGLVPEPVIEPEPPVEPLLKGQGIDPVRVAKIDEKHQKNSRAAK